MEALSLLRLNDVPGAIQQLESELDQLTQSIAQNEGPRKGDLAAAKTYLSLVPPSDARKTLLTPLLEGVPVLRRSECRSALQAPLRSVKGL